MYEHQGCTRSWKRAERQGAALFSGAPGFSWEGFTHRLSVPWGQDPLYLPLQIPSSHGAETWALSLSKYHDGITHNKEAGRAWCCTSEHLGWDLVSPSHTQAQIHLPLWGRVIELGFLPKPCQAFTSHSDSSGQGKWQWDYGPYMGLIKVARCLPGI